MFFWNQTPRWIQNAYCGFEMDVFRANVERIARALPAPGKDIDPERLFERLLFPIRYMDMSTHEWDAVPPSLSARFREFRQNTNLREEMTIANRYFSETDLNFRCHAMESLIRPI